MSRSGGEVSGTHTNTVYASEVCEAPHGCFYKVDAIVEGHVVGTVSDQEIALEFSPTGDGQPTRFNGRVDNDGRTIRGDGWQAVRTQTPRSLLSLPGTPTGLSWTVREDNGDVRLQWTDNSSGESGFAVWGRCLDGGWVQGITNGNFTGLSFHLMAGSSESYCVTAYDIMFWQVPTSSPAGERYFLSPPSNIVEVSVP